MEAYIIFFLCGLIYGIIVSVMFCQFESKFKSLSTFGLGSIVSGFTTIKVLLKDYNFGLDKAFLCFLIALIIGFGICFIYIVQSLNQQEDRKYKVKSVDILLNNKHILELQRQEIEKDIVTKYEERQTQINKKEKELKIKEVEINALYDKYKEYEACIKEQICNNMYMNLPLNVKYPISQNYFEKIPGYVNDLSSYILKTTKATELFLRDYAQYKNDEDLFFEGYLYCIATLTSSVLFNCNNGIRTHFRYLGKDNTYYEYVVGFANKKIDKSNLTPIKCNEGLIHYSITNKTSIIKSINNEDINFKSKNAHKWMDYITITFDELYLNNLAILTMGISVEDKNRHRDYLCFLNYCRIEKIIEKFLLEIDQKCDIIKIVKRKGELSDA